MICAQDVAALMAMIRQLNTSTVSSDPKSLATQLKQLNSTIKPTPVYLAKGKPVISGYTAFGSLSRGSVRSARDTVQAWPRRASCDLNPLLARLPSPWPGRLTSHWLRRSLLGPILLVQGYRGRCHVRKSFSYV